MDGRQITTATILHAHYFASFRLFDRYTRYFIYTLYNILPAPLGRMNFDMIFMILFSHFSASQIMKFIFFLL